MSEIKKTTTEEPVKKDTYVQVENFFLKNRNVIIGALVVIIVAIGGYFGYKKLYLEPRILTAQNSIAPAQKYFSIDSVDLALNGDGTHMGFLSIIDKYGNTPTGNLANYYAGVIYLKKKDFDNAIKCLEKYKPATDEVAGKTHELLGHAYAEKQDFKKAISEYKLAGEKAKNNIQSPFYYKLAGDLLSEQNDMKGALEMYKKIKKEYPLSSEGQNIDVDIAYAETKLGATK